MSGAQGFAVCKNASTRTRKQLRGPVTPYRSPVYLTLWSTEYLYLIEVCDALSLCCYQFYHTVKDCLKHTFAKARICARRVILRCIIAISLLSGQNRCYQYDGNSDLENAKRRIKLTQIPR